MSKFTYKAKKGPADLIGGTIEAEDLEGAIDKIIKLGYTPLDVFIDTAKIEPAKPSPSSGRLISSHFLNRVKIKDISLFTRQLSDLIDAGIPLLRVLSVISSQIPNPQLKEITGQIQSFIQDGGTLSAAVAQHPQMFSMLYINMIKSGELGGNLPVILERLADLIEKDEDTRAKVKGSLIYPGVILLVGTITVFVLLTFVVPKLTVLFDDLAESLPLPTMILIGLSNFFARFWWLILGLLGAGVFYFKKFLSSEEGRFQFDNFRLKLPVVGRFTQDVEIGRFARILGTLLESGVVIVSALESVWAVLDNRILKGEIKKAAEDVKNGSSLTNALRGCSFIPEMAINMVAVGEESGRLDESLFKLADSYEKQSDRTVKAMTSLLEPLLIVIVGFIVFFIVLAVVLPIFKMDLIIK